MVDPTNDPTSSQFESREVQHRLQIVALDASPNGRRWELDVDLRDHEPEPITSILGHFKDSALEAADQWVFPLESRGVTLHLHACAYRAGDQTFAEVRLANDAIARDVTGFRPAGYQKVQLWIGFEGRTLIDTRALSEKGEYIHLFDQTSAAFALGKPLALSSPYLDEHPWVKVLEAAFDNLPKSQQDAVVKTCKRWWTLRDARGEDHWGHTQDVGSAGNRYRDHRLIGYVLWRRGLITQAEYRQLLSAAHHFILEQYGTAFVAEAGEHVFVPGRNYHLISYGRTARAFSRGDSLDARLYQGVIQCRVDKRYPWGEGLETFGRKHLPMLDVSTQEGHEARDWDTDEWVGKRMTGFPCKVPSAITTIGRNGYDVEHHYRNHWHELFVFTPSFFADLSLLNMVEGSRTSQFDQGDYPMSGFRHSDRAAGYMLKLAATSSTYFHRKSPIYSGILLELGCAMINRLNDTSWMPEPFRELTILSRSSGYVNKDAAWSTTAGWQVAIILAAIHEFENANGRRFTDDAAELEEKCEKIITALWREGAGFYENLRVMKDGSDVQFDEPLGMSGTHHWISNHLTDVDLLEGSWKLLRKDHRYEDTDRIVWEWHARQMSFLDYVPQG